jgi:hypothetical protein
MPRREAGRRHDDLGGELGQLGGNRVERAGPQPGADHGQQPRVLLVGPLGEDEDVRAQFCERVGDREAGDRQPQHRDPQALPVGVPAREPGESV